MGFYGAPSSSERMAMAALVKRAWPSGLVLFDLAPPRSPSRMGTDWEDLTDLLIAFTKTPPELDPVWMERHHGMRRVLESFALTDQFEKALQVALADVAVYGSAIKKFSIWLYSPNYRHSEFLLRAYTVLTSREVMPRLESSLGGLFEQRTNFAKTPTNIRKLWALHEWYFWHRSALMAFNYGPWKASAAVSFEKFVGAIEDYGDSVGISDVIDTYGPIWWGFCKWFETRYHVDLLADQQGKPTPPLPDTIRSTRHRPPEYPIWGEQERLLWDITHEDISGFPMTKERAARLAQRPNPTVSDLSFILGLDTPS